MSKDEIERRQSPTPIPNPPQTPRAGAPDVEAVEYSETLRKRLTRYALAMLDQVDADGGPIMPDGTAHPLLDLALAAVDSGTGLRKLAIERRLGGAVLDYRARRPT